MKQKGKRRRGTKCILFFAALVFITSSYIYALLYLFRYYLLNWTQSDPFSNRLSTKIGCTAHLYTVWCTLYLFSSSSFHKYNFLETLESWLHYHHTAGWQAISFATYFHYIMNMHAKYSEKPTRQSKAKRNEKKNEKQK